MIQVSLDWQERRATLGVQIRSLPYNRELLLMLTNIDKLVGKLSRAEVSARRKHRPVSELPELAAVNDAINTLEQWIIMGKLLA